MLQRCNATLPALRAQLSQLRAQAARFGLPLTTYEAGPSIVEASALLEGSITPGAAPRCAQQAPPPARQPPWRPVGSQEQQQQLRATSSTLGAGPPAAHQGPAPSPAPRCSRYISVQRDARFEAIYAAHLAMFEELGLVNTTTPYMHFASAGLPSQYGSW
jgi:hypothetical protein